MVNYRRSRIAGGTYFFTVALRDRRSTLLIEQIGLLRTAIRRVRMRRPFTSDAIVILPEDLRAVMTLPEGDDDHSGRWRAVKSVFTRGLRRAGLPVPASTGGGHAVWQSRFWEHTIRDEIDLRRHGDYIHWNPVKHGLVGRAVDWRFSSFHRYVREGLLTADWAGDPADEAGAGFGE